MVEVLKSFEQTAGQCSPVVLVVPGLAMVVLGLLAWLAGTRLRRLVLGVCGAAVGAAVSFFFLGTRSPALAGIIAGGGAAFGVILPRISMAILLAAFGMAIAFALVTRSHLLDERTTLCGHQGAEQTEEYSVVQSLDVVHTYALDVVDWMRVAARELTPPRWMILGAIGVGLLVAGLFLPRLTAAVTCSMLGPTLIFAGLVLLLMFKGSGPIVHIERQGVFYGLLLLGMAVFGTVEQLLLCRLPPEAATSDAGKSSVREQSKRGWRNR